MSSHALGVFVDIEAPPKGASAANNDYPAQPPVAVTAPSALELDDLQFGSRYNGPQDFGPSPASSAKQGSLSATPVGAQTPRTPNELEMSRPQLNDVAYIAPSWSNPSMNKWRILSACLVYFCNGFNDSAPGALIPYMESHYHIGYAVVSLIFVTNAAGFIVMAFFTDAILNRLGRAKALMLSEFIVIIGYSIIVSTPQFPAVVAAFFFLGSGVAINLALNNVFCASLARATVILGLAHGSYGIGGIVGPIISTALISQGVLWSRVYFVTFSLRFVCLACSGWTFWNYEREAPTRLLTALERTAGRQAAVDQDKPAKLQVLKKALRNRVTIMGALFIFSYQGSEVSESGWVISFLINYRGGDPARVGYVTAGFWGGITLGRFTLTHLAQRVGEKPLVYVLGAGAIAFQLLVWLVPNVIGDAVAVAIVGLLLGPVYPCAQTIFSHLLPPELQTTSISFISSAGSSGGAVAPFTTGLLAQAVGTFVLHPVCIALFAAMCACWFGLPKTSKRSE
ncbi:major facilitator superfamily domain-containing protein [Lineolata rhizophorae]|uniref:Major facilitator superfamily domain-containing protein n=1 Tax=Lineolata rhizophorae TaxID=578093 RepID=A0A6A6P6U9_9PEZI|nr:major facilitator superfamily domain-containing protein [Lineolata rhizophorae]